MAIQRRGSICFNWLKHVTPIAGGSEGAVFSAECFGQKVAVKVLHRPSDQDDAELLSSLNHRNIVRFFGLCDMPRSQFIVHCHAIVTEFCCATMYNLLHGEDQPLISCKELLGWSCQTACGMAYLHSRNVAHRDLKSKNVLLDSSGGIKICDFGMAKLNSSAGELMASMHGTMLYMAPEVMREENYDRKVDLWSYGVLLWEMFTQRLPYDGKNTLAMGVAAYRSILPIPDGLPPELTRILITCLQFDPSRRPQFDDIVAYVTQIAPHEEGQWQERKRIWKATAFSYTVAQLDTMEEEAAVEVELPAHLPSIASSSNSVQTRTNLLIYYGCFAECADFHHDYREGRAVPCCQNGDASTSTIGRVRSLNDLDKFTLEHFCRFSLPRLPHWMVHCILELGQRRCVLQYPISQQGKTAESLLMRFLSSTARPPDLRNEHVDTISLCIYMFLHRMRNRHPLPQAAAIIREAVFEQKEDLLRNAIQCLPVERRDLLALFMVHAHRLRAETNQLLTTTSASVDSNQERSREFNMLRKCLDVDGSCCEADRLGRLLMRIDPGFWDDCLLYGVERIRRH